MPRACVDRGSVTPDYDALAEVVACIGVVHEERLAIEHLYMVHRTPICSSSSCTRHIQNSLPSTCSDSNIIDAAAIVA